MFRWEPGATIPDWLIKEVYSIRVMEVNGEEVLEITEEPYSDSYLVYPGDTLRLLRFDGENDG